MFFSRGMLSTMILEFIFIVSNWQLTLKYYYILTDLRTGNVTRVSPDEYQQLMYQIDDMRMDVSHLDPANRFQIVVYGSHLDISLQSKFSVALRNAYGPLNSGNSNFVVLTFIKFNSILLIFTVY